MKLATKTMLGAIYAATAFGLAAAFARGGADPLAIGLLVGNGVFATITALRLIVRETLAAVAKRLA